MRASIGGPWARFGGTAAVLLASLVLFRIQILGELDLGPASAGSLGVGWGLLLDLGVVLLACSGVALLHALLGLPRALGWLLLGLPVWLVSGANVVYFRYFGDQITLWVLRHHSLDLFSVPAAAFQLAWTGPIVASVALVTLGVAGAAFHARRRPRASSLAKNRTEGVAFGCILALLGAFVLLAASSSQPQYRTVVSDQILLVWAKEALRGPRPGHAGRDPVALHSELRGSVDASRAALLAFREYGATHGALPAVSAAGSASLVRKIEFSADETRAVRGRLALEPDEAPNIIVLFLESVRSFEIDHPELGPMLFPRLRRILDERAIHFPQAYSSAAGAGLTVRGQFSTLCSALPDMTGPPTYLTRYDLGLTCLPELLRSHGYRTFWISSQDSGFHNKALFERAHGTDTIYDSAYFAKKDLQHNFGTCGVADGPFLQEYLQMLERLDDRSAPFFVNTLTITTHAPHTVIAEGKLPPELQRAAEFHPRYLGYLSRLAYLDRALGDFFAAFFRSPLADHTVILLVGDHSFNVSPHFHLEPWQQVELLGRVPLALISAFAPPERIETPVHQADIAPTLASLAGASGSAAWIGRGLFASEGTPWVFAPSIDRVSYRTGDQACYASTVQSHRSCYDLSGGRDPLFDAQLRSIAEDPERLEFFTEVVEANHRLITENQLEPD